MRILIATPEAVPYVKTGGLGDVTGALVKEFRRRNVQASLVLPLYKAIKDAFSPEPTGKTFGLQMGDGLVEGKVWVSDRSPVPQAYFIECERLYGRPELYGLPGNDYSDNALRFAFFSRAVLETCLVMDIRPDVIHCNDWQTGMLPLYLNGLYRKYLDRTATLYTIHNLGYQGIFAASDMKYTGVGREYFTPEGIEFYGKINFMKAGLNYSDLLTTVSETYAREILEKESGFGLEGVLGRRKKDLYGVINGIDYDVWDPAKDEMIPKKYVPDDLSGKADCRRALLRETGIRNEKRPLFGVVSRLSGQKGLDLISESVDDLVRLGVNVVVLGKGDTHYQDLLTDIAGRNRGRIFVRAGFEERLARLIYAGCDFFLMPSRYEPCGLGQLIALRYGAVPVVRKTGGLADTVRDYDHLSAGGTGFLFEDYTPSALKNAVKRAVCVFVDKRRLGGLVRDAMREDFSWEKPAGVYLGLYEKAVNRVRG
ncbi:MAG: glycogen synthase GlgA [Thermodesulfovibrionales bacterium]